MEEKKEKLPSTRIQWYPGHMAKTKKDLIESLKLIDIVIEILDARIPKSSKNPELEQYTKTKKKIIVLNKSDLADENVTKRWVEYYQSKDIVAIPVEANTGKGMKNIIAEIKKEAKEIIDKQTARGRSGYTTKVMIAGIPNVGKSTFINTLIGRKVVNAENRPGVTQKVQWTRVTDGVELLDTPGMLWPKLQDQEVATHLSFINSVGQNAVDNEVLAYSLLKFLVDNYKARVEKRYNVSIQDGEEKDYYEIRNEIAKNTGCLISGGNINEQKVSDILLRDFRTGKLGKITIENI
jgi:ribosome biogenesis GTPase A